MMWFFIGMGWLATGLVASYLWGCFTQSGEAAPTPPPEGQEGEQ